MSHHGWQQGRCPPPPLSRVTLKPDGSGWMLAGKREYDKKGGEDRPTADVWTN
jgi:hypothetical protein